MFVAVVAVSCRSIAVLVGFFTFTMKLVASCSLLSVPPGPVYWYQTSRMLYGPGLNLSSLWSCMALYYIVV